MPVKKETRCCIKESSFIQKTSRPRGWHTNVLNHHLKSGLILSFFYVGKVEVEERANPGVTEGCRYLDTSEGPKDERVHVLGWLTLVDLGLGHGVPITL